MHMLILQLFVTVEQVLAIHKSFPVNTVCDM